MDGFKKQKRKFMLTTIIASIIVGIFSALLVVGVTMLSIKLSANKLAWYFYLLIGVGTFLLSGGICFLLTMPTDKSVAKKLDDEYGLNERTQTMLEFKEQDNAMLRLQRADAENRLRNLPKKKLSLSLIKSTFKKVWKYIVVAIVGLSFFLAGTIVPSRYTPPYDDYFVYNDWDSSALEQLIEDIKNSQTEEKVRLPIVENLLLLNEELKSTSLKSEMREKVKTCASAIDKAVILANSYRVVAEALNDYSDLNKFKNALVNATNSYKNDYRITSLIEVDDRAKSAEEGIRLVLDSYMSDFETDLNSMTEVVTIRAKVIAFLDSFNASLDEDRLTDKKLFDQLENDELYNAMALYSSELGHDAIIYEYQFTTLSYAKELVKTADNNCVSNVAKLLSVQVYNRMIDEFVLNTLSDIFGVTVYPEDLVLSNTSDDGSSSDSPSQGGAVGDEDVIYGGDDAIFDPDSNTHVQYGKVWNVYMAKLYERLNDPDYELSDEMRAYIMQYIKALTGDTSTEE